MHRARQLLFPALILGLLALAAFGVRQVIVGQEQPQPQGPLSREEGRRLSQGQVSEEQAEELLGRINQWNNSHSRAAILDFMGSGGDPCSLPLGELLGHPWPEYPNLAALINDTDLIVKGDLTGTVLEPPPPQDGASRILTTVHVDEVVSGPALDPTITVDLLHVAMQDGGVLMRIAVLEVDPCTPGQVLLFLERTRDPGVFVIDYEGWARIDGDAVNAAARNGLFQDYPDAQALLDAVRQIAQEQQAQGLPKGLLLCRDKWSPLEVCPGDSFNPYQTFRLDTVNEAHVVTTDPSPSPLALARTDLEPGSPQLSALLSALDVQVTVEPLDFAPDDLIGLTVLVSPPVGGRDAFLLEYSPSAGIVQMPPYGGQFPAPPAFQQAMEPFLATPSP